MKNILKRFLIVTALFTVISVLPAVYAAETVYTMSTGKKYHLSSCTYVSKSKTPIAKDKAINSGYKPCKKCKP